jgi:hypothetical protein
MLKIDYTVRGVGWARCEVRHDEQVRVLQVSYLTHGLEQLVMMANACLMGARDMSIDLLDEPGTYRWSFAPISGGIRVSITAYEEMSMFGDPGETTWQMTFDTHRLAFAQAIGDAATAVLQTHGEAEYKRLWSLAAFPSLALQLLQHNIDESTRPVDEDDDNDEGEFLNFDD